MTAHPNHWGITCPFRQCPEGQEPYISINHDRVCSGHWPESWLHRRCYCVVAHEMAHAIGHFHGDPRWADDHRADAVAPSSVLVVPPAAPVGK